MSLEEVYGVPVVRSQYLKAKSYDGERLPVSVDLPTDNLELGRSPELSRRFGETAALCVHLTMGKRSQLSIIRDSGGFIAASTDEDAWFIGGQEVSFGSSTWNTFAYPRDEAVSRRHGSVWLDDGEDVLTVSDFSLNGTGIYLPKHSRYMLGREYENPLTVSSGRAERSLHGDDVMIYRPDLGLFGVLDGMGGVENGGASARLLKDYIEFNFTQQNSGDDYLAELTNACSGAVANRIIDGGTTIALGAIHEVQQGEKVFSWVSVGDSRIYIIDQNLKKITQLSQDEGVGRFVTNMAGVHDGDVVRQKGSRILKKRNRILILSDGVTGDYEEEIMKESEILSISNRYRKPDECASFLCKLARKNDDRSAIVIDIN